MPQSTMAHGTSRDRARISDVAELARVSPGTVSNVFNRPERVARATTERVMAAVRQLGYAPHPAARQLRVGKSRAIGLVVLDAANPYFTELTVGAEERLHAAGYMLVLCSSNGDPARELELLNFLGRNNVDGVIVTPTRNAAELQPVLHEIALPAVVVGSASVENLPHHTVAVDDILGGMIAAEHLLDSGATRLLMLNDPFDLPHCHRRWEGAYRGVRARGLDPKRILSEVVLGARGADSAESSMAGVLRENCGIDGVFCVNDITALGAMRAIKAAGLRIPQDIQVIGFDDISFAKDFPVPLTTVRQPINKLGWTAADLLLKTDTTEFEHVEFTPQLIQRDSTAH